MKSANNDKENNSESLDIPMSNFNLETSQTKCIENAKDYEDNLEPKDSEPSIQNYVENDFESLSEKSNFVATHVSKFRKILLQNLKNYSTILIRTVGIIILCIYIGLFIWFLVCKSESQSLWSVEDNIRFFWLSLLLYIYVFCKIIRAVLVWKNIKMDCIKYSKVNLDKIMRIGFYVFCSGISLAIGGYIIYNAATNDPYNLVSIFGIILLILFSYVFSMAPHMVDWRPVLLGLLLQFIFAWIILTTDAGYEVFKFLGDRVTEFLQHTEAGCKMVFGEYDKHYFAFRILPIIVFLSTVMSILYYLGVIQMLVIIIGTAMQKFMGTTSGESLNAAANIFLGMSESPLLIRPLLGRMTNSELHAVMTGGFATIAGSVLGAYIGYGAPANHLISASVMSAPAALAISKLMCPETKRSKNTKEDIKNLPKSPHKNIIEATTAGASDSIGIVASIAANLIAFVAILSFLNATLSWLGQKFCMIRQLSFELICSYVFWPLTLSMGVHVTDCRKVAELIGIKTFLNEFIAYQRLGQLINNRNIFYKLNQTIDQVSFLNDDILVTYNNGTLVKLVGGILYDNRSIVISTYALCGFANFGSIGILLSSLCSMIPHRRTDLSRLIVRAMIAGNIACFLTASIAGLFYKG